MDKRKPLKIVLVGDGMIGKTCICKSFANKAIYKNQLYQPTISETHLISVIVEWKVFPIVLWDTNSIEEWEHLRSKDYADTDCFLCCYSIDNRTSFTNVENKWIPELRRYCPTIPIIILGLKKDLRTLSNSFIPEDEGRALMAKVKAQGFIECSSRSLSSLEGVFVMTVSTLLDRRASRLNNCNKRKFSCNVL